MLNTYTEFWKDWQPWVFPGKTICHYLMDESIKDKGNTEKENIVTITGDRNIRNRNNSYTLIKI